MKMNPSDITKLVDAWREAGMTAEPIGSIAADADELLKRLSREYRSLLEDRAAARTRIIEQLANGEIDMQSAVLAEHATASAGPEQRERIGLLHRAAVGVVCAQAHAKLAALGDRLITDHLAPAYAELVETVAKNAATVEGIETDAAAVKAGPKVREAWGRIADAETRMQALRTVSRVLRSDRIVTPTPDRLDAVFLSEAHPERRPPQLGHHHPVRRLIAIVGAGVEPGIYTAGQAAEYMAAHEASFRRGGGEAA